VGGKARRDSIAPAVRDVRPALPSGAWSTAAPTATLLQLQAKLFATSAHRHL